MMQILNKYYKGINMVIFTHPKIKVFYLKTLIYKGLNKIIKMCYIATKNVLHNVLHT